MKNPPSFFSGVVLGSATLLGHGSAGVVSGEDDSGSAKSEVPAMVLRPCVPGAAATMVVLRRTARTCSAGRAAENTSGNAVLATRRAAETKSRGAVLVKRSGGGVGSRGGPSVLKQARSKRAGAGSIGHHNERVPPLVVLMVGGGGSLRSCLFLGTISWHAFFPRLRRLEFGLKDCLMPILL